MANNLNYGYYLLVVLIVFVSLLKTVDLHPAAEFSHHTIVTPILYHGREKRQISTTQEESGEHIQHLLITLPKGEEQFDLDLTLDKGFILNGFFIRTQENGKHMIMKRDAKDVEHCSYRGKVRGKRNSWAAISTCNNEVSGMFHDGKEVHYLQKHPHISKIDSEQSHVLYRHSDLISPNISCGYNEDAVQRDHNSHKRSAVSENGQLRGPYNANSESKYVELVLVIDKGVYEIFERNTNRVENYAKSLVNIINQLYAPLNIFIVLVGVVIWTEQDEMYLSNDIQIMLDNFVRYVRDELIKEHPNDNAQLLTITEFPKPTVARAALGTICDYSSAGVNSYYSTIIGRIATTMAHEMGHNLGMKHDSDQCECPDDECIMIAVYNNEGPTHWSSCNFDDLKSTLSSGQAFCLEKKPDSLFGMPFCGNGFVEAGEQCDCGLPEHCNNSCCNPKTCMFHGDAICATGECCDLTTCRLREAKAVCRLARSECDLAEYCTGQSEYCPADTHKMDTTVCKNGESYCYHGICSGTRTDQCQRLFGEAADSGDDKCYEKNIMGNEVGDCGYNKTTKSLIKCAKENVLCGRLACTNPDKIGHVNAVQYNIGSLSDSLTNRCTKLRKLYVENRWDRGLVADGVECGEDKICADQKCLSVFSLRKRHACTNDCNGNGWCDHLRNCHCKEGFAPPFCEQIGHGENEVNGPTSNEIGPQHRNAFCSIGKCCDFTTFQLKKAGTICRAAKSECDLAEFCTGDSEYCPDDVHKMDTEGCNNGNSFCYNGTCSKTKDDQCKVIWGMSAFSSGKRCYKYNIDGEVHGNCGFNTITQSHSKCSYEDVLCGRLFCSAFNDDFVQGINKRYTYYSFNVRYHDSIEMCRSAIFYLKDEERHQVDPGLVADGVKCGEDKMCVNQRCLSVAHLRKGHSCKNDCNGNGWCDTLGRCHCKEGFAPPLCVQPGYDENEVNGPASDSNDENYQ